MDQSLLWKKQMPNCSPRISISPTLPMFLFLYSGFSIHTQVRLRCLEGCQASLCLVPIPRAGHEGQGRFSLSEHSRVAGQRGKRRLTFLFYRGMVPLG